ncbi:MAG: hypothetical protein QOJ09_2668 [Actinomycetota bacterium]|jgi:AcrR family transcriptional regulator|nr:hypothetical protein [Actinomycetota bacterium]
MARPPQFPVEAILTATADIVSEHGPSRATVAAIADRLGAPTGSIYHRFSSRDVLLAELWFQTAEEFQVGFCAALSDGDARDAGLKAALYTPRYVRDHRVPARLLLLHHRDDFIRGEWPAEVAARAGKLGAQMTMALRDFARQAVGSTAAAAIRRARFAVVDLPGAAVEPHLRADEPVPVIVDELVRDAYLSLIPIR